jgi:guanyl-specific ribonuclease Sa
VNRVRTVALVSIALLALTMAGDLGSASARSTINRTVGTFASSSATRSADGTVTARVAFTSPNPRCLSAERWEGGNTKSKHLPHGESEYVHATLAFGGPFHYGKYDHPYGAEGEGDTLDEGYFHSASPSERSPYIWEYTASGSEALPVYPPGATHPIRKLVSEASAINILPSAPGTLILPGPEKRYWETSYNEGSNHIILRCTAYPEKITSRRAIEGVEKLIGL